MYVSSEDEYAPSTPLTTHHDAGPDEWMSWERMSIAQGGCVVRHTKRVTLVVLGATAPGWMYASIPTDGGSCGPPHYMNIQIRSVHMTS